MIEREWSASVKHYHTFSHRACRCAMHAASNTNACMQTCNRSSEVYMLFTGRSLSVISIPQQQCWYL